MRNTDRKWEEQYLGETLQLVERNLENYGRETRRMQAQINEMLEHYHDNDVELWTILNNTITLNEHMKAALIRNEKAKDKPYFGRIIFRDETLGREESLYIGKGGISRDSTHQAVVDWRAPVANVYYENGLGRCSYSAPDGQEIFIDLELKRTYEIRGGKLQEYYDTEVVANDELLTKYLSRNKQAVLGEIVATIQKEQNEIIRRTPFHNLIVQGVAGSGKTTVAMHRISYILYNYQERIRPEDFYIVGSNRLLLNYITGVLPDLDVHGVRQMTMEQLFIRLLYEDWDEKKYCVRPVDQTGSGGQVKGTEDWHNELIAYIRRLEQESISRESVWLNPNQFVEGFRDGRSGVYDMTDDGSFQEKGGPVELLSGEAVARYVSGNPQISIQSKINMLNERLLIKVRDEFLGRGVKYTEAERSAIQKAYRGRYGGRVWKKSIYRIYEEFLREQREKGCGVQIPQDSFDVYDLAALAVIYKLVKETEVISEAHHIVIDEAQDFGMSVYMALKTCIRDCAYTVMGDVSQNIHFGYGLGDWEKLRELILTDPGDSFAILKKSYRNTVEISDFATGILRHGSFPIYPAEPIIRHGSQVVVEAAEDACLARRAAKVCQDWQNKGYETIAVVCRDAEAAKRTASELSEYMAVMESDPEKADFGSGVMVLSVEYTKGLEFDAVLIWDPTRTDYPVDDGHARLLYVAATRALHELCVLYAGELTGLIADPAPERPAGDLSDRPAAGRNDLPRQTVPERKPVTRRPARISVEARGKAGGNPAGESVIERPKTQEPVSRPEKKTPSSAEPAFGDMPATEKLRPAGHSRINLAVKWCARQDDGLYLQSQYGTLRISPVGSGIVRITFAKGGRIKEGIHPLIAADRVEKNFSYRDTGRLIELYTEELLLQADKSSGAIRYFNRERKLLLAERGQECRQIEILPASAGSPERNACRAWLFLDWQKGEHLYALSPAGESGPNLRNTARYFSGSAGEEDRPLPFLMSDKGYGLLPATRGPAFCCDIPAYGSYLCTEPENGQMDYYVIAGRQERTLRNAYGYLCGVKV